MRFEDVSIGADRIDALSYDEKAGTISIYTSGQHEIKIDGDRDQFADMVQLVSDRRSENVKNEAASFAAGVLEFLETWLHDRDVADAS